jgi:hypothetical protein
MRRPATSFIASAAFSREHSVAGAIHHFRHRERSAAIQLAQNNPLTRHSRPRQPHSRAGGGGNPALKIARKADKAKVMSHFVALFDHLDTAIRRYHVVFC